MNKNYNKLNLVTDINKKTGLPLSFLKKLTDDFISILCINIKERDFNLKNLGSFRIIKKKERIGRNPKTREEFIISSRKSLSFYPSKKLIEEINNLHFNE